MKISAFDLDHTLLKVNCSFAIGRYLYQIGQLRLADMLYNTGCYALHKAGFFSLQQLHEKIFERSFQGKLKADYERWTEEFLEQNYSQLIYPPALQKLQHAQQEGDYVLLLSSSPDFIVSRIAKRLGCASQATEYLVDKEGYFYKISYIMDGVAKASFLTEVATRLGVSLADTVAYTDSHLDLPLLNIAGKAVGVNPNRKLKAICQERAWEVV